MQHLLRWSEEIQNFFGKFYIQFTDILEVLILAFLIYHILVWVQKTRAWVLFKGLIVIAIFLLVALALDMDTILWIAQNILGVAITAVVIILQPELRKALEELGKNGFLERFRLIDKRVEEGRFSDKTLQGILNASVAMGKAKTGALIVLERNQDLADYASTGITIDAIVTSQLLINIFEHNTPLHDGAVVIKGDRLVAATCYLPLSDNRAVSKELGTRHRAALGASENTDALIVIVSEETGAISVAREGNLYRNLGADGLQEHLVRFQEKRTEQVQAKSRIIKRLKGTK
ncbi:MAG: diadenylate cyclase CdaA [Lachnospiraceae bacterium]|nr:diadenylate cyclase CdaA [Lachnospiraceae bacterium]